MSVPYFGNQDAESVTNEDDDAPEDQFEIPGASYGDDDEYGGPHFDEPGGL